MGIMVLRSLEQGRFACNQIVFKGRKNAGLLYFDGLPDFLRLDFVKNLKLLSFLKACLWWQPVILQYSLRIILF